MPQSNPLIAETQRRLAHLKSMPETDSRRREMLALERVLLLAPKQAADEAKSRRIVRKRERAVEEDDDEEEDTTPLRRVEHTEGRKKVILHTPKKEEPETESERKAYARERKERLENTLSLVGLTHRGMS